MAGRDYNSVDMSPRQLWEVYLPPFKAAVDAGAATFMNSFNDINGIPATGKTVEITGTTLFRLDEGRIAEEWTCANSLGLMKQLGLLPTPAPSPAAGSHTAGVTRP